MLIEALAKVLLERQTLSGDEVDQVIRATIRATFEVSLLETDQSREADKEEIVMTPEVRHFITEALRVS
jgi:hypothetical protein